MNNHLQQGQGLVEYALVLVLVSVVSIAVLALVGDQIQMAFCDALYGLGDHVDIPAVAACEAPRVTCSGLSNGQTVTGWVSMEAIVQENKGPENIAQVEFFVDGAHSRTEYANRYCLGGGDASCGSLNLSPGQHTIRAVAQDNDGYEGACEVTITVTN